MGAWGHGNWKGHPDLANRTGERCDAVSRGEVSLDIVTGSRTEQVLCRSSQTIPNRQYLGMPPPSCCIEFRSKCSVGMDANTCLFSGPFVSASHK